MLGKSQVSAATMAMVLGSIAAAALLGMAVVALRSALLWVVVAFFLSLVLNPLVDALAARMPRALAVAAVAVGLLALGAGGLLLVVPLFVEQVSALVSSLPSMLDKLSASPAFRSLDARLGVAAALDGVIRAIPEYVAGAAEPMLQLAKGMFRFGLAAVSIFFLVVFMLEGGPRMLRSAARLLGPAARPRAERLARAIYRSTSRYALATGGIALFAGLVAVVTLAAAGVPYFLPLGLLVAVLDLIPFVGAVSAGALLTLVTWATVGYVPAGVVLAVFVVYQQIEGHLMLPIVHRRTVRVPALGLVLALLIGYELAGLVGVLFAVPVAGAARIVFHEIVATRREHRAGLRAAVAPARPQAEEADEQVGPH